MNNQPTKLKRLLPSLRENKRYVAFEAISKTKLDFLQVSRSIWNSCLELLGTNGCAKAGIQVIEDKYKNNKGVIKVNTKYVNHVKSALVLVQKINSKDVILRSLKTSGMINKMEV